ncbi:GNAT family N-acetyltransferase [Streptacidiphilus rugosus]|uniref:GNAT family N-acetyltransferase n=1 Tax=Streptacidiphilus rugosus TaxID=405783 RepID=UPI0005678A63|nr:GNAT family N-acetyltransferase [Streptacidiphilus rugosus]
MTVELKTQRLLLRGWRDEDLDALAAMDGDPEVMRYIGDGSVRDRAGSAAMLARTRASWSERGVGLFAAEDRESGTLLGWVGFAVPTFLPEVLPAVEIGWRLARAHWGHGYATEGARAALRFGFEEAGLDRVVSICHPDNTASERVMTKLGLHLDRETTVPSHGGRVRVLALTRDEYAAKG